MTYTFRRLTDQDKEDAYKVMEEGRSFLKASSSSQWQDGHPSKKTIDDDIASSSLEGLFADGLLIMICAFFFKEDPSYKKIEGSWLLPSSKNYMVMHTFSVLSSFRGKGLSHLMFQKAKEEAIIKHMDSVRGDTYKLNKGMQHIFLREGFKYCGIIYLVDEKKDNDRFAYEYVLRKE